MLSCPQTTSFSEFCPSLANWMGVPVDRSAMDSETCQIPLGSDDISMDTDKVCSLPGSRVRLSKATGREIFSPLEVF